MVESCAVTSDDGRSSGCFRGCKSSAAWRLASTFTMRTTSASFTWVASRFCSDAIYETVSNPVELRGVVVHDHARQLRRASARDLAVAHHARECDGERLASSLVREPADLFPSDFGREDECVRAEHNFFGDGFEPAAQGRAERARGAQEGLRGEVCVDVRLQQKRRRLIREGPAAVYEYEVGLAECGVVEDGFEHHGVAAR